MDSIELIAKIKNDLKDIKNYYSGKEVVNEFTNVADDQDLVNTVHLYNRFISKAPFELYDYFVMLYRKDYSLKILQGYLGVTRQTLESVLIKRFDEKLINYLVTCYKDYLTNT